MKTLTHFFTKQRLIILLVVAVFYGNTLKNGYSLDDSIVTEKDNLTTKGVSAIPKIFKSFYIDGAEDFQFDYRPMVKVSYAIEHELFGVSAGVSHFFNLLFYLTGLYLLFSVSNLLFSADHKDAPFYCVLLFAIMPIHTEVVASLKNRDILLCFIFCMLSLKHFIFFFESGFKKWSSLIISTLCFYLAFLCKYDVLPYLAIMPVIVFAKYRRHLKWVLAYTVLLGFTFLLIKLTKKGLLDKSSSHRLYHYFENPLYFEKGFKFRLIALFNSLGFYINQSLFPFKMCCYYGAGTIPVSTLSLHGYIGILCAPFLAFGVIRSYLKKNFLLFSGLLIFCASASMYLNFVKPAVGIVADRFAFFSSLGIALTMVALLYPLFSSPQKTPANLKVAAWLAILVFAVMTIKRNNEWNTTYTVIDADVSKYPDNAYINYKKGVNLVTLATDKSSRFSPEQRKNKFKEARAYLERSIAIEPNYANTRNYLSYILVYLLNDFNAALPHINRSLAYKETTELYYYKAICMRETRHRDSSEFYLQKCLQMDDHYYNAYGLLMYDYNANKEFQKSIDLFKAAIAKGITTAEMYDGLGKTYRQMGNKAEAKAAYQKAFDLNPNNAEAAAMLKEL